MRCILHIGTEKTGSTQLQHWLFENKSSLSRAGVAQSLVSGPRSNRKLAGFFQENLDNYFNQNGVYSLEEKDKFYKSFRDDFYRELDALSRDHHILLLTSEHFHSRLTEVSEVQSVADFLLPCFSELEIVVYLREQSALRKSLYSTALRAGHASSISEFQRHVPLDSPYYNYNNFLGKWSEVFGDQALKIRIYDSRLLENGDICDDFHAHFLGEIGVLPRSEKLENTSLTMRQAEIYRLINKSIVGSPHSVADKLNQQLKKLALEDDWFRGGPPLIDGRQIELYEKFDLENRRFFTRYFGIDKNIFRKPGREYYDSEDNVDPTAEDVLRIIGMLRPT